MTIFCIHGVLCRSLITLLWPSPGSVGLELASGKSGTEIEGQGQKGLL